MNVRIRSVTRPLLLLLFVAACIAGSGVSSHAQTGKPQREVTTVHGGFVNEAACPFAKLRRTSSPTTFGIDCRGTSSIWSGGFVGHTVVHIVGTIDAYGNIDAAYEEWFYGRYMGDGTQGGLHFKGTFFNDGETAQFFAESRIVDGTCGFLGAAGTFTADGNSVFGGYTAQWSHPSESVTAKPTCNPLFLDSLPLVGGVERVSGR